MHLIELVVGSMSDSVFEIREYLDGNGKVSGHDVLDISKELEFMAKMCGDLEQSAHGDVNVSAWGLSHSAHCVNTWCSNQCITFNSYM